MPSALARGSMIQAAQAKPMSAIPSSVFSPGCVVVFDLDAAAAGFGHLGADVADLPRCWVCWVCWSAVPTVLLVMSRRVPLSHPNTMAFSSSLTICSLSLPWCQAESAPPRHGPAAHDGGDVEAI